MRRTPLKKIGKVGRANLLANKKIKEMFEMTETNKCEIMLGGCNRTWPLAPAHRHKRDWYRKDLTKLYDYKQVVLACQICHNKIEHNSKLTGEVFLRLRGSE